MDLLSLYVSKNPSFIKTNKPLIKGFIKLWTYTDRRFLFKVFKGLEKYWVLEIVTEYGVEQLQDSYIFRELLPYGLRFNWMTDGDYVFDIKKKRLLKFGNMGIHDTKYIKFYGDIYKISHFNAFNNSVSLLITDTPVDCSDIPAITFDILLSIRQAIYFNEIDEHSRLKTYKQNYSNNQYRYCTN